MANLKGFWSYTHEDDEIDDGRISRLADDLVKEYKILTGEKIELLIDTDIEWGENWGKKINSSLATIGFFIPVLTPNFFLSPECRRELQFFSRRAKNLGMKDLILSLRYVDFPELTDENTEDDLIKLVQTFQWEDWSELRFSDLKSKEYREGINRLAKRLVKINRELEESPSAQITPIEEISFEEEDESPGILDALLNTLDRLNELPDTLSVITQEVEEVGRIMRESTEAMQRANEQGKPFGTRLAIAKRTANQLSDPTDKIFSHSNIYASQIHEIDEGYRVLINNAQMVIDLSPENKQSYCNLFESIRNMAKSSIAAVEGSKEMIRAIEPLEQLSRDLRPVMRRLKKALTIMIESTEVSKDWVELMDEIGINCDE